jgi:DNA-directed RNA polymerase subunit RPC12/RpoP
MQYKCFSCGAEFSNLEQLANHKKRHQSSAPESKGVICLGCGKPIPIDSSQSNYSGPLTCPTCRRTMRVILENGEVVGARLG